MDYKPSVESDKVPEPEADIAEIKDVVKDEDMSFFVNVLSNCGYKLFLEKDFIGAK